MKKASRADKPAPRWATQVYLDGPRRRALEAVAERQKRSITKQIEAFIDAGLALEAAK